MKSNTLSTYATTRSLAATLGGALALVALLVPAAPASAEHEYRGKMKRVKTLAYQLHEATDALHYGAKKYSRHPGWYEQRALRSIYNLASRADYFNREVNRYYNNPYRTEEGLHALVRVYGDVQKRFGYLRSKGYLYEDLRCVEDVMVELAYLYGYEVETYTASYRSDDRGYGRDGQYRRAYPRRGYQYRDRY